MRETAATDLEDKTDSLELVSADLLADATEDLDVRTAARDEACIDAYNALL